MPSIQIENDTDWHALRAKNIGGSDVAALFDCSPFTTAFSLWHEKAGNAPRPDVDNQRTRLGKFLEEYIAKELGAELGWNVVRSKEYHVHPRVKGMGCTLDFDIVDHEWGPGICETKVVFDYADYMRDWAEDRAPPNYELQVQHQLAVTGRSWGVIVCMVMQTGSIMPAIVRRPIDSVIQQIETRVFNFWTSISDKTPPTPTGTGTELAIMRHIWPERAPKKITRIADPELNTQASLLRWATEQKAGMERQITASKSLLLAAAQDAETLLVPGFAVGLKQDKRGYIRWNVKEADIDFSDGKPVVTTLNAG